MPTFLSGEILCKNLISISLEKIEKENIWLQWVGYRLNDQSPGAKKQLSTSEETVSLQYTAPSLLYLNYFAHFVFMVAYISIWV